MSLTLGTKQAFAKGGQITVIASAPNGVSSAAGVLLDGNNEGVAGDNGVFTIPHGGQAGHAVIAFMSRGRVDRRPSKHVAAPARLESGQRGEQLAKSRLVVLPAIERPLVDRLADLADAGGADRPLGAMELQAGRLPLQAGRRDQAPRHRFEVVDGLFVVHFVDRHRQNGAPVVHDPAVLLESSGDMDGSLAQRMLLKSVIQHETATSRRSRRQWMNVAWGKRIAKQAEEQVILRHLVHDPLGSSAVDRRQAVEMLLRPAGGWPSAPIRGMQSRGGTTCPSRAGISSNDCRARRSSPAPWI